MHVHVDMCMCMCMCMYVAFGLAQLPDEWGASVGRARMQCAAQIDALWAGLVALSVAVNSEDDTDFAADSVASPLPEPA